jgi:DNA modification methylase
MFDIDTPINLNLSKSQSNFYKLAEKSFENLENKFSSRLNFDDQINRMMVSFQANRIEPQFRWFKYREGFSRKLVSYLLDSYDKKPTSFFDPFAGAGTSLFTAAGRGIDSVGIELLPVGIQVFNARKALFSLPREKIVSDLKLFSQKKPWKKYKSGIPFNHLKITKNAFSEDTEASLSLIRKWIKNSDDEIKPLINLATLGILEDISFTRKDGQFLRWDARAGRERSGKFNKGPVPSFEVALEMKIQQMISDLSEDQSLFLDEKNNVKSELKLLEGNVFTEILQIDAESIETVITSPPYLNRYDYTRTYALELAFLDIDEEKIRSLRQLLLTCTVEHKPKNHEGLDPWVKLAGAAIDRVPEIEIMMNFFNDESRYGRLNNKGITSMIYGYFADSALHLVQAASRIKSGGKYFMINDNVRYNGLTIPVDLILSRLAEEAGFKCLEIKVLPIGKGNSSQQMRDYGKSEMRKCVYVWEKI